MKYLFMQLRIFSIGILVPVFDCFLWKLIYIVYLAQMILGVTLSYQGYGVAPRRRPPRDFAAFVGLQEGFNPDGIV